ncbi:MAG: response regulator, partial [Proteobacteria bacterium]
VQRISQVLANLVSNAVRYTGAGSVSLALLEPVESSGRLTFVVSDTGPGLPQVGVESLRTPLSRDEELRPRKDGSGVGLSVVRTVLDHLGGTVEIDVRPGEGTQFVITIPVLFEDPEGQSSMATPDGLVLVVDDQPDITASVAALVKRYGHPCHVARSGPEAATMLAQNCYETVFLDLDLPGFGGIELASRLRREDCLSQRAYLVAITAARREVPGGLFDEILVKPVEGLRVWWNLTHRSRARRPAWVAEPVSPPSEP